MIIYITLGYGLIVTAGAVGVYLLMRGEVTEYKARALSEWERAEKASGAMALIAAQRDKWSDRALSEQLRSIELEDRLGKIERTRHESAKHARAAQIAQRKAQVLAKAAELQPQVERIAA